MRANEGYKNLEAERDALAARVVEMREQEPVAVSKGYYDGRCVIEPINRALVIPAGRALYLYAAPCARCTELEAKIAGQAAEIEGLKESADYAWQNTRTIDKARQDEMTKCDAMAERIKALEAEVDAAIAKERKLALPE